MISDTERREVAARLRAIDVSDLCDKDGFIIDSPDEHFILLLRIIEEICDYRDGLHYFPSHFQAKAVTELLADLIERPTCKNLATKPADELFCSVCGGTLISRIWRARMITVCATAQHAEARCWDDGWRPGKTRGGEKA